MLWPSRSTGAARRRTGRRAGVEVAQVVGNPVGVAGRRVGQAEAAPVECDDVAVALQRVDDELERGGHVHPAVQHHERRAARRGQRRIAPGQHVVAQTADGDEPAGGGTTRLVRG